MTHWIAVTSRAHDAGLLREMINDTLFLQGDFGASKPTPTLPYQGGSRWQVPLTRGI